MIRLWKISYLYPLAFLDVVGVLEKSQPGSLIYQNAIIDCGKLLFMKDDADVAAEFNKEPMVVGCCACAVGACRAWGIPWRYNWSKLNGGVAINNPSACGEGSGVFNTPCATCSADCTTFC